VDARVRAGLLELLEHAVEAGWSTRRAALLLGLDLYQVRRWADRRRVGGR
jgi:putative transposase